MKVFWTVNRLKCPSDKVIAFQTINREDSENPLRHHQVLTRRATQARNLKTDKANKIRESYENKFEIVGYSPTLQDLCYYIRYVIKVRFDWI